MNIMTILNILSELAADNSRLHKEKVLMREKNNVLLQKVIKAALDPYVRYWQKKIPFYHLVTSTISLELALERLEYIANRNVTGNDAVSHLVSTLRMCNQQDAIVIERIIERDLKCGVAESTVNKIWPGLIPTFDVMLAHKDTSGIVYPAIAQTKMDAARCHLVFDGTNAVAWSRQGREFVLNGALDASAAKWMNAGQTLDGELMFYRNGKPLDRKTSNGLANKAIRGTLSEAEAQDARFVTWDIVDFTSTIDYGDRFAALQQLAKKNKSDKTSRIMLVNSKIVNNAGEAQEFYEEQIADGQEGAVVKNIKSKWVPKRSKDLGKMKAEEEADLLVVGFKPGKGKFEGMVGSLECVTADRKLKVNVSGFNDDDRAMAPDMFDKIITVRYNAVIQDRDTGEYSLFLPRFVEVRFDKTEANNFEDLK